MNDFDKRFKKRQEEFDRDFRVIKRISITGFFLALTVKLILAGGIIWFVVLTLQYLGIVG